MADDDWGRTVRLLTGYEVPDRATLFDELKGSDGKTPLLNVKIENVGLNVSLHDLGGQVGANAGGHAFVLPYYTPQGSGLNLHKISIDFLWNPGERPSQGPGMPLDNFIFGSQVMLEALAGPPFSTEKLGFGGLSVPDNGAVALKTFSDVAGAFDRTAEFFTQHEAALKEWLDSFGKDDASWKGNAAGAFHDVLATLHRNYGDYKEQLVPPGFSPTNYALYPVQGKGASSTKQGDTLVGAANEIHQASWELSQAWHQWAADPDSNAMGIAARLINEVAQWVQDANLSKTGLHNQPSGGMWSGPNVPPTTVVAMPGFTAGHPVWGDLSNLDAWANIGTHSVWQWNQKVQGLLGDPARTQVSNVNNALIQASEVVGQGFKTLNTTSISTYQGSQGSEGGNGGLDDITKDLNDSLGNFSNNLNDSLGNVSDNLGSGLGSFSENLNDSLGNASDNLGSGLGSFSDNLNDSLGNASDNLGSGLGGFSDNLNDSLGNASDNLGSGLGGFSDNLNDSLGNVSDNLGNVTDNLGSATENLGSGLGSFTDNLDDSLGNVTDNLGSVTDNLGSATDNLGSGLGSFTDNLDDSLGNVTDNLGNVTDNLGQGLGSLTDNLGNDLGNLDGLTANPQDPTGTGSLGSPLVPTLPNYSSGSGLGAGATTVRNPDGSTTTTYPDGLVTTTAPDGTVSVRTPDGATIALDPDGTPTRLPDGTTVSLGSDGSLVTQNPDGTTVTHKPDGSLITQNADGSVVTTNPDGSQSFASPNGSVTTFGPDGSETVVSPDGTVSYTSPDGITTITAPDGAVTTFGPDGSATTVHPNGVTTTVGSDGLTTATGPNGETITGNTVPVISQGDTGGSVLDTMNSLGSLGTNPVADTAQPIQPPAYEEAGYDTSTDFPSYGSDTGLGLDGGYGSSYGTDPSAAAAAAHMAGMGGLGGLGGLGGVNGALGADRMREAMGDAGATTAARPAQAATGQSSSTPPYMPPASGQGGQNTESKDRERANWMAEEEDVWGTEDTGNPAVIGRQEQVESSQRNQFMSGDQR